MTLSYTPMLALNIPKSPLLSDAFTKDLLLKMEAAGISKPLPNLSFASSKSASPNMARQTNALTSRDAGFKTHKKLPPIPPKSIISLLELLDRMDGDVSKEVQRVRESIKEANEMIAEYAQAEKQRLSHLEARTDRQKRDTKGFQDDFWLHV